MIAILLDLIVVLVFVVSVYFGYKRGLLASIFHLLGSLISMVLAILLGKLIAPIIFQQAIRPGVVEKISTGIAQASSPAELQAIANQLSNRIPSFLYDLLFEGKNISSFVEENINQQSGVLAENITDTFISPICVLLLGVLLFILFYFVIRLVMRLLTRICLHANDIIILGAINKLFGSVIGAVQGVIYMMLIGMVFTVIVWLTNDQSTFLNSKVIESSYLFLLFYRFNPLTFL